MNVAWFITRRIAFGKGRSFSGFIITIAVAAVALSVAVMLITTATVNGFQNQISRKIFGFWGHIHISKFDLNQSYEDIHPVSIYQSFYPGLDTVPGIKHIQVYAHKAGIIKTDTEIEGIVLKGIGKDFDWTFFKEYLTDGNIISVTDTVKSNDILISNTTARRLSLKTGDKLAVYFVQDPPLVRKFTISGIYKTGLEEYDEKYALIDIRHIQKLNKWEEDEVGGFEVFLNHTEELNHFSDLIYYQIAGQDLQSQNIREINPNIFEWLELQDMNERVILALMTIVAIINMITALLILILERTNMIGILKALGATNWSIRRIFLYNAMYIVGWGLVIGNVLGLGICLLQQHFGFITLPEESYYLSVAPIDINPVTIIVLNLATMVVCLIALVWPSYLVTAINPIKAIRFK
ncbi:ABC transporter permease [Sphingobacteriales bacterium UPWRP_1]|nr:hypothetical protein BVG80_04910 [Sphingobacteriales bacterium TSM_CSM]PSJ76226.1 ABC transporter permease [Sphingobacteriales bacterium UPWRP_1]